MPKIIKSVHFDADDSVWVKAIQVFPQVTPEPAPDSDADETDATSSTDETESPPSLSEAQSHVELMLNQARVQVANWQEEARQTGWEAGYAEGRQAVETELARTVATIRDLAEEAVGAKNRFLRESQAEIGRLAVAIAQKIIHKELTLNPKAITDIVAQAIEAADVQGTCCIRVNPQDYEILGPLWDAIPSLQQPGHTWDLVADKRISRGGCLIEVGNGGVVDARLETQLGQVAAAFDSSVHI